MVLALLPAGGCQHGGQLFLDGQRLVIQLGCQQFAAEHGERQPARAHAAAQIHTVQSARGWRSIFLARGSTRGSLGWASVAFLWQQRAYRWQAIGKGCAYACPSMR